MLAVDMDELAANGQTGQLLEEETARAPPGSESSRTNCLYPAFWPGEAAIRASNSRSVICQD